MTARTAPRVAAGAVLLAFALLCAARLNEFCLLEPDAPGYLFGAKSLASLHGYREIDHPGQPPHTLRPPGVSILLAPLALVAPYHVVSAKVAIVTLATAALVLLGALAAVDRGPRWGPTAVILLVASSPYTLLHATEVVTEIPYLACATGAILLLTRRPGTPSRREIAIAALLLAGLPLLRTIGLALTLAVVVWIAIDRNRRAWWPAPAVSLAVTGLWIARNHAVGGPTYFGSVAAGLERLGPAAYGSAVADAAVFYATRFFEVLLPGVWPGRPLYERMTIGGAPDLGGLDGFGWLAGVAIVALASAGLLARRRDGSLIAMYVVAFLGVLAIYPPRHERLVWPLVPLVWVAAPAGLVAFRERAAGSRLAARAAAAASAAVVILGTGLAVWQSAASCAMARDNLAWRWGGDAFYTERVPPLYFADWQAAGRYVREHAPPGARVLTRHSDVGFGSRREQESVRFEELPPSAWRARIARLAARYLVVPTSLFGKFFPMALLAGDPAYSYKTVYEARDVAVLEVSPNRTGLAAPRRALAAELAPCEAALALAPGRVDLAVRRAELLSENGRREEAIDRLAAIARGGEADVRVVVALGEALLDSGRDAEALDSFRRAAGLPESELLEQRIAHGRSTAEEGVAARSIDKHVRARLAAARARSFMEQLRWAEAFVALDEAVAFEANDPLVLKALAEWMFHVGRNDEAVAAFATAGGRGDPESTTIAVALRSALEIEARPGAAEGPDIVRAAEFFAGEGMPGRALALLETAAARLPNDPAVARHLSDLRRFYGLQERTPASF